MIWSPQQDAALTAVADWLRDPSGPQVFRLFGFAGSGKSTLSRHFAKDLKMVCYAAFTGKAALVMQKHGCTGASTIHSLIYRLEDEMAGEPRFALNPESAVKEADLVIIDEVSMVDEELGRDLQSFGTKILVLGDPFQLPPIKGAGYFTSQEPDIMLTEIHRQAADNPIIRMSIRVREGGELGYGEVDGCKVIKRDEVDRQDVLDADQVIVGRNNTRVTYNDRIRELRGLPHREPTVGDKLVCLKNNREKRLLNGQIFVATEVMPKKNGDMEILMKPEDAGRRRATARILTNQMFFDGTEADVDWKARRRYDEFTFGYALTCHKAQGSQWEDVYIFDESKVFREMADRWLYTALTRAAEKVTVVR